MDNVKRKLVCQAEGSRTLDNPVAESVATLFGKGMDRDKALEILGVADDEELAAVESEPLYQRRLSYLTTYYTKKNKKVVCPSTLDDYQHFAMKQLWRLARNSKSDKDRVSACRCIVENVTDLRKAPKNGATSKTLDFAKLRGASE